MATDADYRELGRIMNGRPPQRGFKRWEVLVRFEDGSEMKMPTHLEHRTKSEAEQEANNLLTWSGRQNCEIVSVTEVR